MLVSSIGYVHPNKRVNVAEGLKSKQNSIGYARFGQDYSNSALFNDLSIKSMFSAIKDKFSASSKISKYSVDMIA